MHIVDEQGLASEQARILAAPDRFSNKFRHPYLHTPRVIYRIQG